MANAGVVYISATAPTPTAAGAATGAGPGTGCRGLRARCRARRLTRLPVGVFHGRPLPEVFGGVEGGRGGRRGSGGVGGRRGGGSRGRGAAGGEVRVVEGFGGNGAGAGQ
eukprot:1182360-Prorocentrum_minimum.AAC.3